jgi:hypothetical protein
MAALTPVATLATPAIQAAETTIQKIKEDPLAYFTKFTFRWGIIFLLSGIALAVGSYLLEGAGNRAVAQGSQRIVNATAALAHFATQPTVGGASWSNYNLGQQLQDIYATLVNATVDVIKTPLDLGYAVYLGITQGLPGGLEIIAGEIAFGIGWLGEQLFAYLILLGGILLLIGIVLKTAMFIRDNLELYLRPRLQVRWKAKMNRYLQRPLDPLLLTKGVVRRASDYNKREAAVTELAYGDPDPNYVMEEFQKELTSREEEESAIIKALPGETKVDETVLQKLEKGRALGKDKWTQYIRGRIVSVMLVTPSDEAIQTSLLNKLAHKETSAIAKLQASNGQLGAAWVGLSENQSSGLAPEYNQETYLWHNERYRVIPRELEEGRSTLVKRYPSVEVSEAEIPGGGWYHLTEIGLYFKWYEEESEEEPKMIGIPRSEPPALGAAPTTADEQISAAVERQYYSDEELGASGPVHHKLTETEYAAMSSEQKAQVPFEDLPPEVQSRGEPKKEEETTMYTMGAGKAMEE